MVFSKEQKFLTLHKVHELQIIFFPVCMFIYFFLFFFIRQIIFLTSERESVRN